MSIVVSNKQKIHYELAGDKGPWMFLHTPHMIPMSAWREGGYVKQLEQNFRLVMIEPLGQGLSDAPVDASHYTIASRIRHILDILREVQADYTFFLGVGLGAQVGFQMSKEFPRRIRSLITIGAQPYQELEEAKYLKEKLDQLR
ncbi:MAG TPA: alpha/beta hydrolase, partial [Candidatus Lambdaproteobacteria bacterium]|nr:alpha/beta hydrolase [Candidatus Lambdaproteobacteria bacterium]